MHGTIRPSMPEQVNVTDITLFYLNRELSRLDAFCFKCCREIPVKDRTVAGATRACEAHFCKPTRLDCKKSASDVPEVVVLATPATHGIAYDFAQYKHETEEQQRIIERLYPLVKQSKDGHVESFDVRLRKFMFMRETEFNRNKKDIIHENDRLKERIRILEAGLVTATPPLTVDLPVIESPKEPEKQVTVAPIVKSVAPSAPSMPQMVISEVVAPVAAPTVKKKSAPDINKYRATQLKKDEDDSDDDTPPVAKRGPSLPTTNIHFYCYAKFECKVDHGEDEDDNLIVCDCAQPDEPLEENDEVITYTLFIEHYPDYDNKIKRWNKLVEISEADSRFGRVNIECMHYSSMDNQGIWDWCDQEMED